MSYELLHAFCALAAFFVPMGFAWFMVRRARRHASRNSRKERPMR